MSGAIVILDRLEALAVAANASEQLTGLALLKAIVGTDVREVLHAEIDAVVREQTHAVGGPPTSSGMAWAIVNRIWGGLS